MAKSDKKVFEVITLITYKNIDKKFLKKYIVISDSIPQNIDGLDAGKHEEFLESRRLNYEVVIK